MPRLLWQWTALKPAALKTDQSSTDNPFSSLRTLGYAFPFLCPPLVFLASLLILGHTGGGWQPMDRALVDSSGVPHCSLPSTQQIMETTSPALGPSGSLHECHMTQDYGLTLFVKICSSFLFLYHEHPLDRPKDTAWLRSLEDIEQAVVEFKPPLFGSVFLKLPTLRGPISSSDRQEG